MWHYVVYLYQFSVLPLSEFRLTLSGIKSVYATLVSLNHLVS